MSLDVLVALQEAHAFDPFPVRDDLGVYHVPFAELSAAHLEASLLESCRRMERVAVVGDSGTGKSSLTASVLGPLATGVAPIVVPVSIEPDDTVSEPRAMFAHIANVIARVATESAAMSPTDREEVLARLTEHRPVGRGGRGGRNLRLGVGWAGWMGASISSELAQQAGPNGARTVPRSAAETLEVVQQMLAIIHRDGLVPVLVFDDTDRWLSGSAFAHPERLARAFFGRVVPALAELRCAVVVAVHRRYLVAGNGGSEAGLRADIERALDTRVEIPLLAHPAAIGAVLASRVRVHLADTVELAEVFTQDAVERLFELYRSGLRGELRGVMRTAHAALTDACDTGADVITARLVDAAYAAWEPT